METTNNQHEKGKRAVLTFTERESELIRIYLSLQQSGDDYVSYVNSNSNNNKVADFYIEEFYKVHNEVTDCIGQYLNEIFMNKTQGYIEWV